MKRDNKPISIKQPSYQRYIRSALSPLKVPLEQRESGGIAEKVRRKIVRLNS